MVGFRALMSNHTTYVFLCILAGSQLIIELPIGFVLEAPTHSEADQRAPDGRSSPSVRYAFHDGRLQGTRGFARAAVRRGVDGCVVR